LSELEGELKIAEVELLKLQDPLPGYTYSRAKLTSVYNQNIDVRRSVDAYHQLANRVKALRSTIALQWDFIQRELYAKDVRTESAFEMKTGDVSAETEVTHENIDDVGGDAPHDVGEGVSIPLNVGQDNLLSLSDFFARPINLGTISVAPGNTFFTDIDLWNVFLSHPSIRAKLRNYAFLRGNMNVRIAISGSPFHYGRVQVSYQPLADWNEVFQYYMPLPAADADQRLCAQSYLSQSRNVAVMDVKANRPLEMKCPFIAPQPVIRLFNNSPLIIPAASPFSDSEGLGRLVVSSIGTVECASATPTAISIFVYAWMTDIQLGAPTGTVLDVTTESGDERKTGPIERVATKAAVVANHLSAIPQLAPIANAAGGALSGIGSLAALFGFSAPTMNTAPTRVKNDPYGNGANTIGYDTGKRIVLDPMQETTVDPVLCGTRHDEMSLKYLCGVESLLDKFAWSASDTPLGSSIWLAPVSPRVMKRALQAPTEYVLQPTALAYAATPFEYWRGDITYHFDIVCSAYHRGKLAIYFEPNIAQAGIIDTVLDLNKQYIKIVDIQETQSVTFKVKWAFPKAWARNLPTDLIRDLSDAAFLGPDYFDYANGYVAVAPFTALQSPDGSPISVNVYVSSDNMYFNQLVEKNIPKELPTTESGTEFTDKSKCEDLNDSKATLTNITEFHFGELPLSFRAILKRFMSYDTAQSISMAPGDVMVRATKPIWSEPRPVFGGGATSSYPNFYSYLRYAYIGFRGGMKFRVGFMTGYEFGSLEKVKIRMVAPSLVASDILTASSNQSDFASRYEGTVEYIPRTNGGVEFGLPCYTNNLFGISFSNDPFPATNTMVDPRLSRSFQVAIPVTDDTSTGKFQLEFAGAEDLAFFGFNGGVPFIATIP
jgi:hypothetical protein